MSDKGDDMNPSQSISLTQKGVDEVSKRVYKLSMKKRSVLILLQEARTIQYVLDRAVLDAKELLDEIVDLGKEGFLKLGGENASVGVSVPSNKAEQPKISPARLEGGLDIHEEIILSEARFLMVDFCVDVFGTGSQTFVDKLGSCKSVGQFTECVKQICEATKSKHPEKIQAFEVVLKEINKTAS
jgi:hypothetical protein